MRPYRITMALDNGGEVVDRQVAPNPFAATMACMQATSPLQLPRIVALMVEPV